MTWCFATLPFACCFGTGLIRGGDLDLPCCVGAFVRGGDLDLPCCGGGFIRGGNLDVPRGRGSGLEGSAGRLHFCPLSYVLRWFVSTKATCQLERSPSNSSSSPMRFLHHERNRIPT